MQVHKSEHTKPLTEKRQRIATPENTNHLNNNQTDCFPRNAGPKMKINPTRSHYPFTPGDTTSSLLQIIIYEHFIMLPL